MVRAVEGDDQVDIAFVVDPTSAGPAAGRWLLNLRELRQTPELQASIDDAFAEVLGRRPKRRVRVVMNALMLSPEFSGPTRATCDDPRLLNRFVALFWEASPR